MIWFNGICILIFVITLIFIFSFVIKTKKEEWTAKQRGEQMQYADVFDENGNQIIGDIPLYMCEKIAARHNAAIIRIFNIF